MRFESSVETNRKNKSQDDFVEIVDVVKPRHERTPEIIDLSSEVEATGSGEHSHKGKAKKQSIEAIEISSDSGAEVKDNTNAPAADSIASQSSDNEHKQAARRQLEDEIAARAEFKRILESSRLSRIKKMCCSQRMILSPQMKKILKHPMRKLFNLMKKIKK